MTAVLFVTTALVIALACLILSVPRTWRLAVLAGFILAIVAEAPRAATEFWGQTVPGIVAATQETLRLESVRAAGARSSHYNPKHRFGAVVCYRLPGNPGLGAPLDPAIQAAIGETPSEADRTCRQTPGSDILRQTEIRLDEATYDATRRHGNHPTRTPAARPARMGLANRRPPAALARPPLTRQRHPHRPAGRNPRDHHRPARPHPAHPPRP